METRSKIIKFAIPAIVVLFGLVIYQYGYIKIRAEMSSVREMQVMKSRTLEKYITIISERPLIEARLASSKEQRKADDAKIIEGQTYSLSANTLEDIVKGIITGRGGSISSERVEKPDDLGAFKVVNVSMDVVLPDTRALSDIIYSIETRTPYIIIKELDVRARNIREPRELMVKLRIAALTGGK
ncbi:MAG: GspMb/PilO family protein [Syntrophorhabdaceae bacterium]|nr:GspMb/PilO family protein [Syntrophorhabdaceae bacterium]MDD5245348.1 GspMb/PilO family protein [Syntrophorhabdaceae bacterium]